MIQSVSRSLVVIGILTLLILTAAGWAGWRYLRSQRVDWSVQRGRALLGAARTPEESQAALELWARETSDYWRESPEKLVDLLLARDGVEDPAVRMMLRYAGAVDYGERVEDWKRWQRDRELLQKGQPPEPPSRQRIRLEARWEAPIGATTWLSTVLPLDGEIYVSSCGAGAQATPDDSDGIVRVDGKTGAAVLWFVPPDGTTRNVVGLAACSGVLYATCANGYVYAVSRAGELRWKTQAGDALASVPMLVDLNRDGTCDVVAMTRSGRVIAFSGTQGNVIWKTAALRRRAGEREFDAGATLAVLPQSDTRKAPDILAVSPHGELRILTPLGKPRWEGNLPAGGLPGPLSGAVQDGAGPPALVGDTAGSVWSLVRSGGSFQLVAGWSAAANAGFSAVARPRALMAIERAALTQPGLIIACPIHSGGAQTSIFGLEAGGVRWRNPLRGEVWGTPVIADVNGDLLCDVVIAATQVQGNDAVGMLNVLSHDGHCLLRQALPAALECPPAVADVDGDGTLELLIADHAGLLRCYGTNSRGPVEWGLACGDSHNTGNALNAYSFGQLFFGKQAEWQP